MKKVLFVPVSHTTWREIFLIAGYIKAHDIASPIIFIVSDVTASYIPEINNNGIDCIQIDFQEPRLNSEKTTRVQQLSKRFLKAIVCKNRYVKNACLQLLNHYTLSTFGIARQTRDMGKFLRKRYMEIGKIFDIVKPDCVVVSGDRHFVMGVEPTILKICRENNIPSIIPPIAYTANPQSLTVTRNSVQFYADKYPWIKRRYPKQVIFDPRWQKNIQFYPPDLTEALARNDMLPENPWVIGGGNSTFVLADGEETKERYIKLGCRPEKILVTGHPSHDNLYSLYKNRHKLRDSLNQEYAFDPGKKLIILALPQLAEHGIMDWKSHWDEIRFLCDTFSQQQQVSYLISLHPKMKYDQYKFIENEYNIPISKRPLVEILPAADIFAATFSSTVQWAVLCHIPSIVFDFYGFNYNVYNFLNGVRVINKKKELKTVLDKLIVDKEFYHKMSLEQKKMAPYISPFDGKCMKRIVDVILNVKAGNLRDFKTDLESLRTVSNPRCQEKAVVSD